MKWALGYLGAVAVAWAFIRGATRGQAPRPDRERGAVLVEYALILPVAVMLGVSGLFYGLAMVSDLRITHAVSQGVQLEEADAGALVLMAGGTLECYWQGTGPGGCFDDGLDGLERRQAVAVGETYHPPLFDPVTPRAEAVGVVPAEP